MRHQWLLLSVHLALFVMFFAITATANPHSNVALEPSTTFPTIPQPFTLSLPRRSDPEEDPLDALPTNEPLPRPQDYPLQYALNHGWSILVAAHSYVYPTGTAYLDLSNFFHHVQAFALAQMLQNARPRCQVYLDAGNLDLGILMHPQSSVRIVEWSLVYQIAGFLLQLVQRGFGGHGYMYFRHPSGIWLGVIMQDADSVPRRENVVWDDQSCSSNANGQTPH